MVGEGVSLGGEGRYYQILATQGLRPRSQALQLGWSRIPHWLASFFCKLYGGNPRYMALSHLQSGESLGLNHLGRAAAVRGGRGAGRSTR